ncbi:MAG: lipoprotein-releasing ABC transporter permease subunit, partial [Gammaproteobacteria bacterium]|nr:lipoprotein-releasing ABC transporter permease subunit [Gammaproteobacteria bacterium]
RRDSFVSIISLISILSVALGVMVLIVVLSVMNGFEKELRLRILGMTSHATIRGDDNRLKDWEEVAQLTTKHPEVIGYAPFVQGEGMLSFGSEVNATMVRGILPEQEPNVSEVHDKMKFGKIDDLKAGEFGIVLGAELAHALGAVRGDKVTLIVPQASVTVAGILPRMKRFTIVGIFQVGMYEYDSALAFLHIEDAAKLFRIPGEVSGVRLKLKDMFRAQQVTRDLVNDLPGDYWVSDWTRQHANFFRAVKMEKTVMTVLLSFFFLISGFSLLAALVMLVVDKQADIAILRTLGSTPRSIMSIFLLQGCIIGFVGILIGSVVGVTLAVNLESIVAWIEQVFDIVFLAPDVYYISDLPSDLKPSDVGLICIIAFLSSILFTLYPAWRASHVQPADALRYE